jgi:hypothetical protein
VMALDEHARTPGWRIAASISVSIRNIIRRR